jgi:hypothetical protein
VIFQQQTWSFDLDRHGVSLKKQPLWRKSTSLNMLTKNINKT